MKFNDEYDSERHMEMVGKYMPGRKRKVFTCEIFDSRISLQVCYADCLQQLANLDENNRGYRSTNYPIKSCFISL